MLPFLPSWAWANPHPNAQVKQGLPPKRFLSLVAGDGFHPTGWWAKAGAGKAVGELGSTLEPLAPFKDRMAYIANLNHKRQMARVHGYGFTTFLTCTYAPSGKIKADVSLDQLLAQTYGRDTPLPSLVLGVEPLRPGIVNGAPSIYQATCSWSSPTTPVAPEVNPRQAFDRLFDVSSLKADESVLDYVLDSSKRVRQRISTDDREKLDQYLTSVREIEKRIQAATEGRPANWWQPTLAEPNIARPTAELMNDPKGHMEIMLDLLVLALQMDKTRVANFILTQDFSSARFNYIEGVGNSTGHSISHHQNEQARVEEYKRVNRYHAQEIAHLLSRLDEVQEGNGTTLLDNTMVFFGSCMMDGNTHTRETLPIVLLGGGHSGLNYGYHDFKDAGPQSLGRLLVSIAQNMGLDVDRVGDQDTPLPGLFRAA
ncbi:MAG: DUF1552 domain-containing protein [Opitutales bacterium]